MDTGGNIKEGYVQTLKVANNGYKHWEKRYLILRGRTDKKPARLDWHFDKDSFISSTGLREFSYISLKHVDDKEHSFEMINKDSNKDNIVLALDNRKDMSNWMFAIHDLLDPALPFEELNKKVTLPEFVELKPVKSQTSAVPTFRVTLDDSILTTSLRMAGKDYQAQILPDLLVLSDIETGKLTDIPYSSIRRYLKGMNNFTFETFSRSEIGGGVWRLLTNEANAFNREFVRAVSAAWQRYAKQASANGTATRNTDL